MFRIRSVVEYATSASSLAGAVITRDRKASRKTWLNGVVGRRGRKAWSEDTTGRRVRKTWPEGVARRRGQKTCSWFRASSPESCSPVEGNFKMLHSSRYRFGWLEEVSRFQTQAMSCCCCVAKDMGLSLSLPHNSVEAAKSGSWCEDLSPLIHTVRWCQVRPDAEFLPVGSLPV